MRSVIGQRRLLDHIGAQVTRGDAAHAYGLSGPRSIGKRTVALRIAQTLNCVAAERGAGGCGRCRGCTLISSGGHPDVQLITRADDKRDISIEQIREMQEDLALRPLEGQRRVVIIDDAAHLSEPAEIALLKTLEEPPSHAVLLLLTPTPEALFETTRSRLQSLTFRLVPTSEIVDGLRERKLAEPERYAAAAAGRPGIAISLASEDASRADRRRLDDEFFKLMNGGLTDRFAWAATLAAEDDPQLRTREIARRLVHWGELVRDAAVTSHGVDGVMRPDRASETAAIARAASPRELVDAALLFDRMRRDLEWNANARAMLELIALKTPYTGPKS